MRKYILLKYNFMLIGKFQIISEEKIVNMKIPTWTGKDFHVLLETQ